MMDGIVFLLNETGLALQQLKAEISRLTQVVAERDARIAELEAKQR